MAQQKINYYQRKYETELLDWDLFKTNFMEGFNIYLRNNKQHNHRTTPKKLFDEKDAPISRKRTREEARIKPESAAKRSHFDLNSYYPSFFAFAATLTPSQDIDDSYEFART